MVWHRLRIAADTSLAALHFIFQIVQGWGDDHLHQFHIMAKITVFLTTGTSALWISGIRDGRSKWREGIRDGGIAHDCPTVFHALQYQY